MPLVDAQTILPGKIAFGKTEIMDRIQQIGFAYPVTAADAHNTFVKTELLVEIIFELIK